MCSRVLIGTSATALIGAAHSSGIPALMCLAVLFPVICAVQLTRRTSAFCTVAYYLGAGWPIVAVTRNYLGPAEGTPAGLLLWLGAALILAIPWLWAWSPRRKICAAKMCAAIITGIIPPLGIIGIANPAVVSGFIFPGLKWLGVSLTIVLPAAILLIPWHSLMSVFTLALVCNYFAQVSPPQPVSGWESVNTTFNIKENAFDRLSWIRARVEGSAASVILFPENVIPNWTTATDLFWAETEHFLEKQNRVALIGVTVPTATHVRNVLMIRGAENGGFDQRIPVPIGMWRFFRPGGVPLNVMAVGTIEVGGRRAAVLICYEQLLPWTWLTAFATRPSIIVAIANDYWSHQTTLSKYRTAAARSWARLFSLPIVTASNE